MAGPDRTALSVRPHRSRLQRPCDACRKAKQACVVPVQENPCIRCTDRNSLCTFRLPSSNRHRRCVRNVGVSNGTDENGRIEHVRNNSQIPEVPGTHVSRGSSVFAVHQRSHDADSDSGAEHAASACPARMESRISHQYHHVGSSALSQIHLAASDSGSQLQQISLDSSKPVFFAWTPEFFAKSPTVRGVSTFQNINNMLEARETGLAQKLYEIYLERTCPTIQIVNSAQLVQATEVTQKDDEQQPFVILSGILAHSLGYTRRHRDLHTSIWVAIQDLLDVEYRRPTISTLQLALLNLTSRPSRNVGGNAIEMARLIGASQLLGLHMDSSAWNLPEEEQKLRDRIWWTIVIEDIFRAILYGRSSHLASSSWTTKVPKFMPTGFESQSLVDSQDAFTATCGMAMVARHIYEDFYAPKPTYDISCCNRHLRPAVIRRMETLQVELDEVHDSWNARLRSYDRQIIPCSGTGLRASQLAYLGLRVNLSQIRLDTYRENLPASVVEAATSACEAVVLLLETITEEETEMFWPPYAHCHIVNAAATLLRCAMHLQDRSPGDPMVSGVPDHISRHYNLASRLSGTLRIKLSYGWEVAESSAARINRLYRAIESVLPIFRTLKIDLGQTNDVPADLTHVHQLGAANQAGHAGSVVNDHLAPTPDYGATMDETIPWLEEWLSWWNADEDAIGLD